jgi:hypothetical protein
MHRRQLTSRRSVLQALAGLVAPALVARDSPTVPGSDRSAEGDISVRLVREIKYAQVLDLSPDGAELCLYYSRNPTRSFRSSGEAWRENKNPIPKNADALRVINSSSWVQNYATKLPALPFYGSFFADGSAIYVGVPGVTESGQSGSADLIVDVKAGQISEHFDLYRPDATSFFYWATTDKTLLGLGYDPELRRTDVVVLAEAPSFKEIRRAPFAENRPAGSKGETRIATSLDRRTFAYGVDDRVIYRNTSDLSVIWNQPMVPSLKMWHATISPRGGLVAASSNDGYLDGPQMRRVQEGYVGVFDASTGRAITRIYADATEGIAISPDEKLLAIGQRVFMPGKTSGTQPTVLLFDIASGKRVATMVHDQFREGGGEFLRAGVSVRFTPDGKYLISSGLNTKIWEIG